MTVPSELFHLESRMQVTINQRAAMICWSFSHNLHEHLCTVSSVDISWPINLILAIRTEDFIHIQCKFRTTGRKTTISILPVGSVIMPHAVFFFASLSSTASHWSSVPIEHLVKANKIKCLCTSLTTGSFVEFWYTINPHNRVRFVTVRRLYLASLNGWYDPISEWMLNAFWDN